MKRAQNLFFLALCFLLTLLLVPRETGPGPHASIMLEASRRYALYQDSIASYRETHGPPIEKDHDPNATGIIGVEFSPLTTTLGNLPAKRTTTNPNLAAVYIHYFHSLGLRPGDRIAAGASSSFPGAILALWAASESYGLDMRLITSLGSSSWGANDPLFTYLDMERHLQEEGLLEGETAWVSLGGYNDQGETFWPGGMEMAHEALARTGYPLLSGDTIQATRDFRWEFYNEKPPRLYINIGGGGASLGSYPYNNQVSPGLQRFTSLSRAPEQGIVHRYLQRGVPVLNILDIQYLSRAFSLPFDPQPLPPPGQGPLYEREYYSPVQGVPLFLLTFLYLLLIVRRKGGRELAMDKTILSKR